MKFVSFIRSGEERLGLLAGDVVVDALLVPVVRKIGRLDEKK
jgi:hypothetical protein